MSIYANTLKRLTLPGFVAHNEILSFTNRDEGLAQCVADLCIGTGSLSTPDYYIGSLDSPRAPNRRAGIILTDSYGRPLLIVNNAGLASGSAKPVYSVSAWHGVSFKERGNDRSTLASIKPSYLVKQLSKWKADIAKEGMNLYGDDVNQAFTWAASKIQDRARIGGNYVADLYLLNELADFALGNIPSLSQGALNAAATYARETGKTIANKANVVNLFNELFTGKKFYVCAVIGLYGIAVAEVSVATTDANALPINIDRFIGAAHRYVKYDTPYRTFRNLAHMKVAAPELHAGLFLQLAMNKQAITGIKPDQQFLAIHSGMGTMDYAAMFPYGDNFFETINAVSWSRGSMGNGAVAINIVEKIA